MTVPIGGHELNRSLQVWRPDLTDDGAGGQSVAYAQAGTVRARVSQPTAAEQVEAAQAGATHTQPVYLLPDADVRRGDELRGDGDVFRVKATIVPSEPVYLRADVELIQHEPPEDGT
ncbi:MAG TPA: head-tail adaptor protein [Candidatus Limnocylindrales bacterium]